MSLFCYVQLTNTAWPRQNSATLPLIAASPDIADGGHRSICILSSNSPPCARAALLPRDRSHREAPGFQAQWEHVGGPSKHRSAPETLWLRVLLDLAFHFLNSRPNFLVSIHTHRLAFTQHPRLQQGSLRKGRNRHGRLATPECLHVYREEGHGHSRAGMCIPDP